MKKRLVNEKKTEELILIVDGAAWAMAKFP